jgi:anti-sigma regulatory factor (Ser/Thr protein kinase)
MQTRDERCSHQKLDLSAGAPPAADRHRRMLLVPAPESTCTARDFTIATLRAWYLDALIQDTVLVVSELVTNAIRHGTAGHGDSAGDAPVELSLCCQSSSLICAVTDRSVSPPVLSLADPDAESGRGLQVVHALAVDWGWTALRTHGKAVWAAFELPADVRPADREPRGWHPAMGRVGEQSLDSRCPDMIGL